MKKVKDILEINKILDMFSKYIKTNLGLNILLNKQISNDKKYIIKEYTKLDEIYKIIENFNELPIYSKLDMYKEIESLKKGSLMDGNKLNELKDEITSTLDLITYFSKNDITSLNLKLIPNLISSLRPNTKLYSKIISSISNDGEILDQASKELYEIRRELRSIDKEIHSRLTKIINSNKDKINGDNYVIRNGHYSIPISSSLKNTILGVVQDISDSGATTFIEPYEIAELENKRNVLELKERDEISKILDSFRSEIMFDSSSLINNNEVICELDYLSAKYKYMKNFNASIPHISNSNKVRLIKARHPLLDQNIVVANDFIFGEDKTFLLISGPNAGGKTIALKTLATLAYLTKLALPLTVEEGSEIPLFNNIYLDIGDNQSIESNLSTFSSQISNISYILKYVTNKDLVIFDELCNGTDPKEGEALSIAISKYLIEKGSISGVSSHYQLLKKFGLENEHVLSASFLFDEKKIRPTYKMLLGVSGKSFGFLIANKYGISSTIVDDAKKIYEKNYLSKEDRRIEVIEEKERQLEFKEERLKTFEKKLSKEQSKIDQEKNKISLRIEKLNQNKSEEFDRYLDEKYKEINDIYKEFLNSKNAKKAMEKLAKISIDEEIDPTISIGDYVLIKGLETKGTVSNVKGNKISVINEDGFTIDTNLDTLKKLPKPQSKIEKTTNVDTKILKSVDVPSSINLIGYHSYEGVEMMEKYISDCLINNKTSCRVIHGFGSGRLRMALWEALKKNPHVESFTLCDESNGGGGATSIKLK